MKRTAEIVLSIISIVFNVISLGIVIFLTMSSQFVTNDPLIEEELRNNMYGAELTEADIDIALNSTQDIITFMTTIGWILVAVIIITIILTIIGTVKINKSTKTAGVLFIISAILSGIISFPGILLIIAAILCFVRKPKNEIQQPADHEMV
ncbi:DUF4064 domain-containing protein [Ureibacillus sp. NPDC094379]